MIRVCAGESHFDTDRPRRAARAEQDHRLAGRVDPFGKGLEETLAIGVFADVVTVTADHAVDRSDDPRRFAEAVKVLDHRDLVRNRAVESGKVHRPRARTASASFSGGTSKLMYRHGS